jgi:cytoskeletal protein RodZ
MAKRRKRRQTKKSLPVSVWIIGLAGIILVGVGLIVLTDQSGSNPNPSSLPHPNVPRVSPAEAHNQQQSGTGVIIDVREAQYYEASRAAGALSVPEEELLAHIEDLPNDKTLIFY